MCARQAKPGDAGSFGRQVHPFDARCVVIARRGEGHATVVVITDQGSLMLDNPV
jgi:hypothetical protein